MKKILGVTLAVLTLSLAACSKAPAQESTTAGDVATTVAAAEQTGAVDLAALKASMIDTLAIEGAVDVASDRLTALYGIDAADVADSACFIKMEGSFPDEIVMIKAASADAAGRIAEKLGVKLDDVLNQSKNYDADNYAIAQTCKVVTKGDYVSLFISAKHVEMEKMFDEAVK